MCLLVASATAPGGSPARTHPNLKPASEPNTASIACRPAAGSDVCPLRATASSTCACCGSRGAHWVLGSAPTACMAWPASRRHTHTHTGARRPASRRHSTQVPVSQRARRVHTHLVRKEHAYAGPLVAPGVEELPHVLHAAVHLRLAVRVPAQPEVQHAAVRCGGDRAARPAPLTRLLTPAPPSAQRPGTRPAACG